MEAFTPFKLTPLCATSSYFEREVFITGLARSQQGRTCRAHTLCLTTRATPVVALLPLSLSDPHISLAGSME